MGTTNYQFTLGIAILSIMALATWLISIAISKEKEAKTMGFGRKKKKQEDVLPPLEDMGVVDSSTGKTMAPTPETPEQGLSVNDVVGLAESTKVELLQKILAELEKNNQLLKEMKEEED